jgi:hypothetical protein
MSTLDRQPRTNPGAFSPLTGRRVDPGTFAPNPPRANQAVPLAPAPPKTPMQPAAKKVTR